MTKTLNWKEIYKNSILKERDKDYFKSFALGYVREIAKSPECTPAERGRRINAFFEALDEVEAERSTKS